MREGWTNQPKVKDSRKVLPNFAKGGIPFATNAAMPLLPKSAHELERLADYMVRRNYTHLFCGHQKPRDEDPLLRIIHKSARRLSLIDVTALSAHPVGPRILRVQ